MKKYTAYKTVQLVLFILVAVVVIAWVFPNSGIYHEVAVNPTMKLLAGALWAVLLLSFVFILLDYVFFFNHLKEYKEMDLAVHSDPLSGIANRFSCDIMIEKYLDKPLPEDMGCIMFDLTNIQQINRLFGHLQGNMAIRDFSNILRLSSDELCFVGRNGGNKFLAIFEHCTEDDIQKFLDRISMRVENHNRDVMNSPLEYAYGKAFHEEGVKDITGLVSLANSRIKL